MTKFNIPLTKPWTKDQKLLWTNLDMPSRMIYAKATVGQEPPDLPQDEFNHLNPYGGVTNNPTGSGSSIACHLCDDSGIKEDHGLQICGCGQYTPQDPSKGKHNKESKAAYRKGNKQADRNSIIFLLKQQPYNAKEIAQLLGKPLHAISGRLTELKKEHIIEPTQEVREGSRVMRMMPV